MVEHNEPLPEAIRDEVELTVEPRVPSPLIHGD